MKLDRRFLLLYDGLILMALWLQYSTYGTRLFGSQVLYYLVVCSVALVLLVVNKRSFLHVTPLDVVAKIVNLIVGHHFTKPNQLYQKDELLDVIPHFIETQAFNHFFYEEFNYTTVSDTTDSVRLKLALKTERFNKAIVIIKLDEQKYVKFTLVKLCENKYTAFLYEWKLDKISYTTRLEFEQIKQH